MEQTTPESTQDDDSVYVFPKKEVATDHYELMLLIGGGASDEEAKAVFEAVKKELVAAGGEVTFEDVLGRRTLGYSIAGSRAGNYFVAEFDLLKSKLADFNEKLRIRKDIARFLIVKKRKKTAEEIEQEKKMRQRQMIYKEQKRLKVAMEESEAKAEAKEVAKKEEETKAPALEAVKSEAPVEETKEEAPASVEKPKSAGKKPLEEIDKEIEKLLSDDIDV